MGIETILKMYLRNNIPYSTLEEISKTKISIGSYKETVNIYIDFESIIKPFLNLEVIKEYDSFDTEELRFLLIALLANTAGHYRHYFYKYKKKFTNIYFFYASKVNKQYVDIMPEYKKDFYSKYIEVDKELPTYKYSKLLKTVIKNFKGLVRYLSYIYFIDMNEFDKNSVPYFLDKMYGESVSNSILLSNDIILYQYSYLLRNLSIFTMNGHRSKCITKDILIPSLIQRENISKMPYRLFHNILSITGYKKYNMVGIPGMGYVKTYNLFNKYIATGIIRSEGYYDMEELISDLKKVPRISKIENMESLIRINSKLTNMKYIVNNYIKSSVIQEYINESIIDKYNYRLLIEMNNTHFKLEPLSLEFLMEGSDYKF